MVEFLQTTTPTPAKVGDLWLNPSTGLMYYCAQKDPVAIWTQCAPIPIVGGKDLVQVTAADTLTLTAAMTGTTIIATKTSATQVFTLPAAATPGLNYRFVCGVGNSASEIQVAVGTGDNILGKIHASNDGTALASTVTTGVLKNTAATNVVGDFVKLVSDGITTWYMAEEAGVWSAT